MVCLGVCPIFLSEWRQEFHRILKSALLPNIDVDFCDFSSPSVLIGVFDICACLSGVLFVTYLDTASTDLP